MNFEKFKKAIFTLLSIACHKNTEFLFSTPKKTGILILDSVDENRLRVALLRGIDYAVLDTRYKNGKLKFRVHLSPKMVCFAMYGLLTGLPIWDSYCYAVIRCISPRVVIDNVHMSSVLPLAQRMLHIRFFVILNGIQANILDRDVIKNSYTYALKDTFRQYPQRVSNVHVFCFGKKESDIFRQRGLDEVTTGIHYHDIGSLFGDYIKSLQCMGVNKNDYDIVFVSQCSEDSIMGSEKIANRLVENTSIAIRNLNRYLVEKDQRCLILLRGGIEVEYSEIAFYRSLFDKSAQIEFHRNDSAFAVYEGLTRAPIIVSLYSTTGFEAMAWGKKVLFCLYGFTKIYKISSDEYGSDAEMLKWSLENSEYPAFKKCLDDLVEINLSDYLSQNAEVANYIISSSRERPAHVYIRDMILSELSRSEHPERLRNVL